MLVSVLAAIFHAPSAAAIAPIIFSQPAYQSPVRGDPGDLLVVPGDGFSASDTVVYQAVGNTTQPLAAPAAIPAWSDASAGVASIISSADVPHSLTVLLPAVLKTDQSYAMWVQHADGEWSNGVLINDARPLWITPDSAYVSANTANLPRYLKVVGRNLQPAPGATTQVMLTGPSSYTLTASNDNYPTDSIDRYAAKVTLPTNMTPGTYTVQVSRDGGSWVAVASGQTLTVNPDPVAPATFPVSAYGCTANDGVDDTPCIVAAIAAARANGGGSVTFDPGTWHMSNSSQAGVVYYGVLVPVGVNLSGAGASTTTIVRDTTWYMGTSIFTLQGHNIVQGITFQDAYQYQPTDPGRMLLGLGVAPVNAQSYNSTDPSVLSDVVITQNVFDQPYTALEDHGMPIDHLFVTNNVFGAYMTGLFLDSTHYFSDSVVAYNTFEPGSYVNTSANQGTIASQISAAQRLDFNNNVADGTATEYLYNPATDPKGFRAAFFWAVFGNDAQVLISQNTATCPGDKIGDGESFAFDSNGNTSALPTVEPVLAASANTVTVQGPLLTPATGTAYNELWVQITGGTGVGQLRPVVSYTDPTAQTVILTIAPAWDVTPGSDSLVTTSKEYWQVYTVDNFVDQRQPECTKANTTEPSGGVINQWSGSSDSAIEGNQLYDTSGILYSATYTVQSATYSTVPTSGFQAFLDIRNNTIEGEYDWGASCSYSGIRGWYGASPDTSIPPPLGSYGVSISHNTVSGADDFRGGAISLNASWHTGPAPSTWQYMNNTLIFRNSINNITNPASAPDSAYANCTATFPRQGIHINDALPWHTVLYANSCTNVAQNLFDQGTATVRACPSGNGTAGVVPANSCECAPYVQGNQSVATASSSAGSLTWPGAQNAGDLNLVIVDWKGSAVVTSVTDSSGNSYSLLGGVVVTANANQVIYYAANIAAATSNTVNVVFNSPASGLVVRLAEYQGLATTNPIDVATSSSGVGVVADSGWVTTTNPNDLLLGVELTGDTTAAPTPLLGSSARASIAGQGLGSYLISDQYATAIGAYHASATNAASNWWLMQFVALRLAGGGDTNTQALTAPAGLTATAASSSQINLAWTGSTDNIGVAGYLIERCAGASCANFTQVGNVGAGVTSFSDSGLPAGTTYSYRVRATDTATLLSAYTAVVDAATLAQ